MGVVGVLHPGAMGGFVASAISDDHHVAWVSAGRSPETRQRANALREFASLPELVATAEAIISICPPGRALDQATAVAGHGFTGLYLDANAVSPAAMAAIDGALVNATVVDGAIIGGPSSDSARLHLSGTAAATARALFDPQRITVHVLDAPVGSASALKAAFALTSKAHSALLFASRAAARASGVEAALLDEWERTQPGLPATIDRGAATIGRKAWRFVDEMREAAAYLDGVGVPSGFSTAAADVFERLADLPRGADVDPARTYDAISSTDDDPADQPT